VSSKRLDWLIARLSRLIQAATDALEASYPAGVPAWEAEISRQLARYHAAAMLAGADVATLTPPMRTAVTRDLATQLAYLKQFGVQVQSAGQWERGYQARAKMYARSIQIPSWKGVTQLLPLPAMPAEGTTCLTNCGCSWDVQQLEGEGNYDAYWRRGKEDSCQVCRQRELEWAPVRIREGVLQI
jgi:hypothetical protein